VDKDKRVQRRFIRYALRSLGWTDTYDLPSYEHRFALLRLDTLMKRRSKACIMFIVDNLSGRMNSPNLLSALDLNTARYRTRGLEFLWIGFHRTNYRNHEPTSAAIRKFNEVIGRLDEVILTRNQFMNRLKLTLLTYLTLPQNKLCTPCAVVHGPSYRLTNSRGVIVASSINCRDGNHPLLVFFLFYMYLYVPLFVYLVLSISLKLSVRHQRNK
jgi:hypothetical protein